MWRDLLCSIYKDDLALAHGFGIDVLPGIRTNARKYKLLLDLVYLSCILDTVF